MSQGSGGPAGCPTGSPFPRGQVQATAGSGVLRSAGRDQILPARRDPGEAPCPWETSAGSHLRTAVLGSLAEGGRSQGWQILVRPGAKLGRQMGSAGPWAATGSPGDRRETAGEGAAPGCPLPGLGPLPPARGPPGHSRGAVSTGVCPHCPARGVPCRRPRTSPGILFP